MIEERTQFLADYHTWMSKNTLPVGSKIAEWFGDEGKTVSELDIETNTLFRWWPSKENPEVVVATTSSASEKAQEEVRKMMSNLHKETENEKISC